LTSRNSPIPPSQVWEEVVLEASAVAVLVAVALAEVVLEAVASVEAASVAASVVVILTFNQLNNRQ
jgi:hypothetical protein